jgi:hypothetical protein
MAWRCGCRRPPASAPAAATPEAPSHSGRLKRWRPLQALLGRPCLRSALRRGRSAPALQGLVATALAPAPGLAQLLELAPRVRDAPGGPTGGNTRVSSTRRSPRIGRTAACPARPLGGTAVPAAQEGQRVVRPAPSAELVDHARVRVERAARVGPDVGPLGLARPGSSSGMGSRRRAAPRH